MSQVLMLARAPKPVPPPASRRPQGLEVVVSCVIPVGESNPRFGARSPHFHVKKETIMPEQASSSSQSLYFDLHVEGVGYLNRVRTVKPKKGQEFIACTVSAMRGSTDDIGYTKFDCRVSGADAQKIVKR